MKKRYISFILAILLTLPFLMEITKVPVLANIDKELKENTLSTEEMPLIDEEIELRDDEVAIQFDTVGGKEIPPQIIKKGEKLDELPKPERDGDKFLCWEYEDYIEVKTPLIVEDDIILYARWENDIEEDLLNEEDTIVETKINEIPVINNSTKSRVSKSNLRSSKDGELPTELGEVKLSKTATPVEGKLNTWDIKLQVLAKDDPKTSDIILVIDTSGSMGSYGRMTAAKKAAKKFVDTLLPSDQTRIGIVDFAGSANIASGLTNEESSLNNAIDGLQASGGTFTQAGIRKAKEILDNSPADNKHIVLLSDGVPTYSYKHNTKDANFEYDSSDRRYYTKIGLPLSEYHTSVVGSGGSLTTNAKTAGNWWNIKYYDYHHGNSAINEAQYAKDAGYTIWPIGLSVNSTGAGILQQIGSGTYYDASPATLEGIFEEIAGEIGAAVQDATVSDPMGQGFEIKGDNITNISATQGTPSYDAIEKRLTWNPGTLTTLLPGQEDIRYAELTYRVEINDDILNASSEDGLYHTNGTTTIHYKNASGEDVSTEFEVPKVKPILYKVEKELQDKDGNIITKDENFNIEINGPSNFNHKIKLNTKESGNVSTEWLTNLREIGEHSFVETNNDDYETNYYIKNSEGEWVESDIFNVATNSDNFELKVVNKEALGTLTIKKILNGEDLSGTDPKTFEFKVTGPDNFEEVFSLPDEDDLWTKTIEDLKFGSYKVEELTTGYITSAKVNGDTVNINDIKLVFSKENPDYTVEFTNEYKTVDLKIDKRIKGSTEKIAGAEFALYQTNDNWALGAQIGETKISDGVNNIIFENLTPGKYILKETKAPEGYVSEQGMWKIVVDSEANLTIDPNLETDSNLDEIVYIIYNTPINLPETGGLGRGDYYKFGSIIIFMALALFINRKR